MRSPVRATWLWIALGAVLMTASCQWAGDTKAVKVSFAALKTQLDDVNTRLNNAIQNNETDRIQSLDKELNTVLDAGHALRAYSISEAEFRARDDLLRTLQARPPVVDGRVRVVEIEGFDAQACGGTHVRTTAEVGRFSIVRTENKGRANKRLYVRLDAP